MKILVLAGGVGSRLKSVVSDVPKALAPIGGVPFLHLQLEAWIEQGAKSFVFLLGYRADLILAFLHKYESTLLNGCEVRYVIETTPLNTGGAVAFAVSELSLTGDFLLVNADTWLGNGYKIISSSKGPAVGVLEVPDTSRYGQIEFDERMLITRFSEKSEKRRPGWINSGICRLNTEYFSNWDGHPFSLENRTLVELVNKRLLKAITLDTSFIDIGIPDDYHKFCQWIESGRKGEL